MSLAGDPFSEAPSAIQALGVSVLRMARTYEVSLRDSAPVDITRGLAWRRPTSREDDPVGGRRLTTPERREARPRRARERRPQRRRADDDGLPIQPAVRKRQHDDLDAGSLEVSAQRVHTASSGSRPGFHVFRSILAPPGFLSDLTARIQAERPDRLYTVVSPEVLFALLRLQLEKSGVPGGASTR